MRFWNTPTLFTSHTCLDCTSAHVQTLKWAGHQSFEPFYQSHHTHRHRHRHTSMQKLPTHIHKQRQRQTHTHTHTHTEIKRPINRQTDKHTHTFTGLLFFSLLNFFGPFWYDSGILSTAVSFTVSLVLIALGTIKLDNNVIWHVIYVCIYDNR